MSQLFKTFSLAIVVLQAIAMNVAQVSATPIPSTFGTSLYTRDSAVDYSSLNHTGKLIEVDAYDAGKDVTKDLWSTYYVNNSIVEKTGENSTVAGIADLASLLEAYVSAQRLYSKQDNATFQDNINIIYASMDGHFNGETRGYATTTGGSNYSCYENSRAAIALLDAYDVLKDDAFVNRASDIVAFLDSKFDSSKGVPSEDGSSNTYFTTLAAVTASIRLDSYKKFTSSKLSTDGLKYLNDKLWNNGTLKTTSVDNSTYAVISEDASTVGAGLMLSSILKGTDDKSEDWKKISTAIADLGINRKERLYRNDVNSTSTYWNSSLVDIEFLMLGYSEFYGITDISVDDSHKYSDEVIRELDLIYSLARGDDKKTYARAINPENSKFAMQNWYAYSGVKVSGNPLDANNVGILHNQAAVAHIYLTASEITACA